MHTRLHGIAAIINALANLAAASTRLIRQLTVTTLLLASPGSEQATDINPPCHLDNWPRTSCESSAAGSRYA